ncbi:23S rRNA (adenine(2503)-C(2))-methyltransferase RlmN [Clostridium sporogenes]|uniref:Probable dual-specificity RNA methyltransferase RlmN n=1 Tax=Clostridium botulinum TaxID=1491 RepID=A0A6M0T4T9_CLOBO|nr:23S rRNA (adenine(2503)-C(2))-methyltransferase RlmN [Clostridium sporogenes]NFA61121.1 23S rRNA (adenine(2503)-C(2))-methyltransferase RlmN [Clostridium botulinum]NFI75194.1 23S rRNA (adenine(2503)-C(2))-methyltransferase RlmN [Clostridium sporogenes]NFL72068.1 23S rRNA (adenine(2503)-C(2))-methyltransferase RlmN [Clostridium sporogenes]NFM24869.1 23S rRNA (adenine(2503)-C(2))-methyltransferase RlmN [Clostridium sporogenes]NFP62992.1 23S rRNA (adenine(2503)-C(2))-methyltransferase RlmN [Cl
MENILDFKLEELKEWLISKEEKAFRAKQIFNWIYDKFIFEFNDMKNIPEKTKGLLSDNFYIGVPKIIKKLVSQDNNTYKFLFEYKDGNIIESVVMKYKHGNSICVSTQVGCRMGCKFCASTLDGVIRNLTSGEILSQILVAQKEIGERISNVVLMGSGEPLDNFENVTKFLDLVTSDTTLNIGQRHITLSTCGIVPKIKELADKEYNITLAISLHAPEDLLRKEMMPIANKYSIKDLMEACDYYIDKTNRRITFEYALVKGKNDSIKEAKKLGELLKGKLCHVNLIPVNEIKENSYKKSTSKNIGSFGSILKENGVETTIRREMGADINAACGQLRRSYVSK